MNDKCRNCPDVKYRQCPSPNIIANGGYRCESEQASNSTAVCDHCENPLVFKHFAYEFNWNEFWCEDCLKELLESTETAKVP